MPDCLDSDNLNANETLPNEIGDMETGFTETQPSDDGSATESGTPETAGDEMKMDIPDQGEISAPPADLPGRTVSGNNGVIFDYQTESNSDKENHLGKGLVKPTSVQVAIDGYHFSYEKPAPRLAKAESFMKETAVEKRVVNPEFETPVLKPDTAQPVIGEYVPIDVTKPAEVSDQDFPLPEEWQAEGDGKTPDQVDADQVQVEMALDEAEAVSEEGSDPGMEEPAEPEVEPLPPEPESPAEASPEETPEPAADEADLEPAKSVETTLLAGRQTWFGVPLPSLYRITNRGIVLIDSANRSRQIPWEAIAGIRLKQSIIGKILGVGNIELLLEEGGSSPVIIEGVLKPGEVIKKLEELMDIAV